MARDDMMQGRARYSYKETKYSRRGIASVIFGFLSLFIFIILLVISMVIPSVSGDWIGALGFTAFVMGVIGMIEGLASMQDSVKSYMPSKFGTVFSALMTAAWFLIFCFGLAS